MKAPKILPWIARKAGISDELALKLWRRACGEAGLLAGKTTGSDYHRLSVERFLTLAEEESAAAGNVPGVAGVTWLWRHQARMSFYSLIAAQNALRLWQSHWQDAWAPRKAA